MMEIIIINDLYLSDFQDDDIINIAFKVKNCLKYDSIIQIDYCITLNDDHRLKLVKCLRLLDVDNPIIFSAYFNLLQKIKEDSSFLILLSKGVFFIELPKELSFVLNNTIEFEKANKQNLVPFFRSELDLQAIRHDLANKWGIERIKLITQSTAISLNYYYELISYLNPKINSKDKKNLISKLSVKFTSLKVKFSKTKPTIIFYDDCAEEWGPALKDIFGVNFHFFSPKNVNEDALFQKIEELKPTSILLDLRLKNEKEISSDPKVFSGAKTLTKIKESYFTLPIIMFTATNKAESVRELLRIGADYVWTKEGIDNGIDDYYTWQNLVNLLYIIDNNHFKFITEEQKSIFEIECKINNFKYNRSFEESIKKIKLHHDTIVVDTNFFINQPEHLVCFYNLLKSNQNLKTKINEKSYKYPLEFIIHNDVFREIFTLSQSNNNKELSKFLMRYIYKLIDECLITNELESGQVERLNNIQDLNFNEIDLLPNIETKSFNFFNKVFIHFNTNFQTNLNQINVEINQKKYDIENIRKMVSNLRLHADDTFKELIPSLIENNKSVLFLCNDNECAYNVGEKLKIKNLQNIEILDDYWIKSSKDNNRIKKTGVKKISDKYWHLKNDEFYNEFTDNKLSF